MKSHRATNAGILRHYQIQGGGELSIYFIIFDQLPDEVQQFQKSFVIMSEWTSWTIKKISGQSYFMVIVVMPTLPKIIMQKVYLFVHFSFTDHQSSTIKLF